jgi:hypothetical protein
MVLAENIIEAKIQGMAMTVQVWAAMRNWLGVS